MNWTGFDQITLQQVVTVTFTLFAVIDVLGSIPLFVSLKNKMGDIHAGQATLVSGALMMLFFLIGEEVLHFMGLDIQSFAIAGSIVIFILGLEMVLGHDIFRSDSNGGRAGSIVPIAFPIIAGSGTLTTVMSLKAAYHPYNILIGIIINLIIVYICLRSINVIERMLGPGGISVVRKFFGVILLAISIKIFRNNLGVLSFH